MAGLPPLLRRYREAAGLTQEQLAGRAGLSTRTVSDIERGLRSRLYADTAERLTVALDLDGHARHLFLEAARGRTAARRWTSQLPQPLTPLVARENELATLTRVLLPTGRRLVTVTGLGGVGKTRLALAAAEGLLAAYDGMVRFAEVAPNQEPSRVPGLIAGALGAASDVSPEQLASYLAGGPALVVLDGFEGVLAASSAVESLLTSVPALHLLLTSRDRVPITGGYQLALQPLTVPEPTSPSWRTTGAVALFLARAADVQAEVDLDPELVVDICRRLSGLPLALELAAALMRHLPLASLRERLHAGLNELAESEPDRRRSLVETLSWSLSSLGPEERSILEVSALCPAGWRLDVLQHVCGPEASVLGAMGILVDRGIVLLDRSPAGADAMPRWRMLDVVREFASRSQPPTPALRNAYARAMVELVSRAGADMGHEDAWFRLLASEEANVVGALRWAEQDQDAETLLRLACGMWQYWQARGALVEGRRWLSSGLRMEPPARDETRMTALWGSAWLAYQQGAYSAAAAAGAELDRLATAADHPAGLRNAATVLGMVAIADERTGTAVELLDRALDIARSLGDPWILATSLLNQGLAHLSAGEAESARAAVGEALGRYADIGDERFHARCLGYLGLTSLLEGDLTRSRALFAQSLRAFHALSEPAGMAEGIAGLAAINAATGHMSRAATLAGAADKLRESYSGQGLPPDRRTTELYLDAARQQLGDDIWNLERQRGRQLNPDEAVALGLRPLRHRTTADGHRQRVAADERARACAARPLPDVLH